MVFPNPLSVQPGETRAFYLRQTTGFLSYTDGDGVGTTEADDGTLRILEGTGINLLFGSVANNRIPNVTLHYVRTPDVLTTTFRTGNSNAGIMFDVTATNSLSVETLQFPINGGVGPFTVNLYSKAGTHVGFETDATAWSLMASVSVNVSAAGSTSVPVSLPSPILIPQGGTRAFFIHSAETLVRYSNGGPELVGNPEASDANLTIRKGRSMGGLFFGPSSARVPNVSIYYRDPDRSAPVLTIIGTKRIRATGPKAKIFGVASDDVRLAGVQASYRQATSRGLGRKITKPLPLGTSGLFFLNLKLAPGRNLATFHATDASGRSSAPVRVTVIR